MSKHVTHEYETFSVRTYVTYENTRGPSAITLTWMYSYEGYI